MLITNKKLFSR